MHEGNQRITGDALKTRGWLRSTTSKPTQSSRNHSTEHDMRRTCTSPLAHTHIRTQNTDAQSVSTQPLSDNRASAILCMPARSTEKLSFSIRILLTEPDFIIPMLSCMGCNDEHIPSLRFSRPATISLHGSRVYHIDEHRAALHLELCRFPHAMEPAWHP